MHAGHLEMLRQAAALGDRLVVILNNDNWLMAKKGYVFMPQTMRKQVLESIRFVHEVHVTEHGENDPDRSVCVALERIRPHIFANGGDRLLDNVPEVQLCKKLGIKMVFDVGLGGKIESSSAMVRRVVQAVKRDVRPWGEMTVYEHQPSWWVKKMVIYPNSRASLQTHKKRSEMWVMVEGTIEATVTKGKREVKKTMKVGDTITILPGQRHRFSSKKGATFIEVASGKPHEHDIVRHEDDYGRVDA